MDWWAEGCSVAACGQASAVNERERGRGRADSRYKLDAGEAVGKLWGWVVGAGRGKCMQGISGTQFSRGRGTEAGRHRQAISLPSDGGALL